MVQPLRLATPATEVVGDAVQILHVHVAVTDPAALHIGYAIGRMEGGRFVAQVTKTLTLTEADGATYPVNGPAAAVAAQTLVSKAYDLLVEGGFIGAIAP